MKKNNKYKVYKFFFLFLLLLTLPCKTYAFAEEDASKGSIEVILKDLGTSKKDVGFKLYQVGNWTLDNKLELLTCFNDTNIDLETDNHSQAAKTLSKHASLATLTSIDKTTDKDGHALFSNLELGVYLLVQSDTKEYGLVSPTLIVLPYTMNQVSKNDVVIRPKAELIPEEKGQIIVTKKCTQYNEAKQEENALIFNEAVTFYVSLFSDADGQYRYGEIKSIVMNGVSEASVTFDNLPAGSYTVFETDQDGNPYVLNDLNTDAKGDWICKLTSISQTVVLDGKKESPAGQVSFCNQFIITEPEPTPTPTPTPSATPSVSPTPTPTVVPSIPTNTVSTGDNAPVMITLFAMAISGALLYGGYRYKTRKGKN